MDINLVLCDKDGDDRSLDSFKRECLDLFINDQTFTLEVDPTKLISPKDKLQHLALIKLQEDGILVSYGGQTGTISYFLTEEIWDFKKDFSLSIDFLTNFAELYNVVMPSIIGESGMFKPIGPLEVDVPIIESLVSILNLTLAASVSKSHLEEPEEGDSPENTYSFV